jgi:hypothetical protein
MKLQSYFAHDSKCKVVPNIATIYPTSCSGAAACACTAGTATTWSQRVGLFGTSTSGEIIASPSDPRQAFYLWLHEPSSTAMCGYNSQNGHRYNILMAGPSVGVGVTNAGASVGDFGGAAGGSYKIPSGSHYPQGGASIEMWANWKDSAAPSQAIVNVEGTCTAMTLKFGTAQSGAWSTTLTGLGTTCKRYRFEWKDSAGATVTYPQTGSFYTGSSGTTGCASDGSDFSREPTPVLRLHPELWRQAVRRRRLRQRLWHLRGRHKLSGHPVHRHWRWRRWRNQQRRWWRPRYKPRHGRCHRHWLQLRSRSVVRTGHSACRCDGGTPRTGHRSSPLPPQLAIDVTSRATHHAH